jgi:photosystem II stability/assembly factor-like uncharacterized protein
MPARNCCAANKTPQKNKNIDDSPSTVADFPFRLHVPSVILFLCAIFDATRCETYTMRKWKIIMKNIAIYLPGILVCAAMVGCAPSAPATANPTTAPAATETAIPTPRPAWKEVGRSRIADFPTHLYYAGFADARHGIAIGYAGAIRYTEDGGATWKEGSNDSWCRFGLEMIDAATAYTCGNGPHVRFSQDGGKTWSAKTDWGVGEPNQCRYLSFVDAQTGWAATPTLLARTKDGGVTWQDLSLPAKSEQIMSISFTSSENGFMMDNIGNLFGTKDGGSTWTMVSSTFGQAMSLTSEKTLTEDHSPYLAMRFLDIQNGIIAFRKVARDASGITVVSLEVMHTADGGQTWTIETIPGYTTRYYLFLSRDGNTLTLTDPDKTEIVVLSYS